jgi:DNA (cytosine-5)-methyltransferase 1
MPASLHPLAPLSVAELRRRYLGRERGRAIDFFAGGGGFTNGALLAGLPVVLAANHWTKSYDTHSANFPQAEHLLGDLSVMDPKRFSRSMANILVCSPECRTHSNARNHREAINELSPFDPSRESERSRCTMWCPQRFAEWMHFDYVICENVIEVTRWNRFTDWVKEWEKVGPGYHVDMVSANSAFFGNPQSRDRAFFVMTRKGLPRPNLDFRPPAWCWTCERDTNGVQVFKSAAQRRGGIVGPYGKFNQQWHYLCEMCASVCSPYIVPARSAIDWTIEAPRIGDRARLGLRELAEKTLARIEWGLELVGAVPQLARIDGRDPKSQRSRPIWLPAMTQTGRQELGLFGPADEHALVYMRSNVQPTVLNDPALTLCASGNHHALIGGDGASLPGPDEAYLAAYNGSGHNMRRVDDPAGTLVTSDRHGLLVPAGGTRQNTPVSVAENPSPTRMTRDTHGIVEPGSRRGRIKVHEATFRMLAPHETAQLMSLHERPDGSPYTFAGSGRDIVRQTGNAVVPPVPANLIDRCLVAQGA